MIKLIFSDDNAELVKAAGAMVTLIENDRHIKQAASSAISEKLIRDNLPDKDHFAAHLIAMGSDEHYGPNRNGDGWPEHGLTRDHATFVTHGHYFREHKNTHPKFAIGRVKASAYNTPMHRVELIIWGHKKKAEQEYERAKAGKTSSYSMSAKVPYDVCSCCDNQAAKSAYYCDHLKHHMLQYIPKFRKFAYAKNPKAKYFDISDVANPADRIAHYLEYRFNDEHQKSASAGNFLFSDQMAEINGVVIPEDYIKGMADHELQTWLDKMASAELYCEECIKGIAPMDARRQFVKNAAAYAFDTTDFPDALVEKMKLVEPGTLFTQLTKRAAVLPFTTFCAYSLGMTQQQVREDVVCKEAQTLLPGIFRKMQGMNADSDLEILFTPDMTKAGAWVTTADEELFDAVAERSSVSVKSARSRIMNNAAGRGLTPLPSSYSLLARPLSPDQRGRAEKIAQTYGIYKVAFCAANSQLSDKEIVDETAQLLVIYQHLI